MAYMNAAILGLALLAGLSALGKPLTAEWVHRPERFAELTDLEPGAEITPQAINRLLLHPQGGLKRIPPGARRLVLFNQADTPAMQSLAQGMAPELLSAYSAAIVAALAPPGPLRKPRRQRRRRGDDGVQPRSFRSLANYPQDVA